MIYEVSKLSDEKNSVIQFASLLVKLYEFELGEDLENYSSNVARDNYIRFIKGSINDENHLFLSAEYEDRIVGCLVAKISESLSVVNSDSQGIISRLYVEEDYRGRGIRKALFYGSEGWFSEKGIKKERVLTLVNNETALAFYRNLGMKDLFLILQKDF